MLGLMRITLCLHVECVHDVALFAVPPMIKLLLDGDGDPMALIHQSRLPPQRNPVRHAL